METIIDPLRGSSAPDRDWTLTNVAENTPEVMTPLCWTVWGSSQEKPWRQAWYEFGILPKSEVRWPTDPNERFIACFFGRQALNVDLVVRYMGALPGTSPQEVEQHLLGGTRDNTPEVSTPYHRIPVLFARMAQVVATQRRLAKRTYDDQLGWWQSSILPAAGRDEPRQVLADSRERLRRAVHVHVRSRSVLQSLQSQVAQLTARAGAGDLAGRLFGGFGGVEETGIAEALWEVAHGQRGMDSFLRRYGFHGPAEGNLISRSWREDPTALESVIDNLTGRRDEDHPRAREAVAVRAREEAEVELIARLPRHRRALGRAVLRAAAGSARDMEVSKAAFIMAIDGCRAAARDFGAQLVAAGTVAEVDDAFYFTIDEVLDGLPPDPPAVVAFRRARRDEYVVTDVPVNFRGMPEPSHSTASLGRPADADTISGAPGGPGSVEGRAMVVLSSSEGAEVQPGDVLVCRFTDPSWSPLFCLAEALVIDLGGPGSHGAIVARELGLPCVIGTGDGTARIKTGDRVRVDGDTGTVTILERL